MTLRSRWSLGAATVRPAALLVALTLTACGAPRAEAPRPAAARADEPEPPAEAPAAPEPAAEAPEAPPAEPPPPPEPEPIEVVAGAALGPIRIDMSEDAVRALGLEEREADPRSRFFGPYRVYFDDGGVQRVEAIIGELGRIRVGDDVFAAGTHIHALRDALEGCVWYEGGGERYRCADGTLFVHTTHTLDPDRYTIAVERRE